jgi:hypothetical protein
MAKKTTKTAATRTPKAKPAKKREGKLSAKESSETLSPIDVLQERAWPRLNASVANDGSYILGDADMASDIATQHLFANQKERKLPT